MAAEWNHCLSTDKIGALPPVTLTEYKPRRAPRAPTFIVETCEQAVSKAHKGAKRRRCTRLENSLESPLFRK